MNVFCKITLQTLKKNTVRTVVTIIGVLLSTAMICAVTTFTASMQNYALEYVTYISGDWHGALYDVDEAQCRAVAEDERVSAEAYSQILGYAAIDSANEQKPYVYILGGSESFFDMLPVHLTEGRLPQTAQELLLPEHLQVDSGGDAYRIGDTLTLALGDRSADGYALKQNNPYAGADGETLVLRETRTYTVVGFYERPSFENRSAPSYTALTLADETAARCNVYFKLYDPASVYDYVAQWDGESDCNSDVLLYSGVSRYSSFTRVLTNLAVLVIVLIMLGSIALIYNAFSISVSERTRQFGLLASVGATRKQLRRAILFEAGAVSAVGIPLGLLCGIGGMGLTLHVLSQRFSSLIFGSFDRPIGLCVSARSVAVAVGVALVTVLLSAWIPARRATRVSAVDAIRRTRDIRGRGKTMRTAGATYRLFGLSGVLAAKHFRNDRKKYRATVISLFLSIVLFVSASAFTDYLTESVTGGLGKNGYDLLYVSEDPDDESAHALLSEFAQNEQVTRIACVRTYYFDGSIETSDLSQSFLDRLFYLAAEGEDAAHARLSGRLSFVDDDAFRALLAEHGVDEAAYFDADAPLGIALDGNIGFDAKREKFVVLDTLAGDGAEIVCRARRVFDGCVYLGQSRTPDGETCYRYAPEDDPDAVTELTAAEALVGFSLRTGKTITDAPFFIDRSIPVHLNVIYPMSALAAVLPTGCDARDEAEASYRLYMTCGDHAAAYDALSDTLSAKGLDTSGLVDYAAQQESSRNLVLIIRVFADGFIILISLIAAANVFNTVSTNVRLRRREFAMLKSVGMTQRGLRRMMNYECLLYGTKALALGLPVSAAFTALIYRTISEGYETSFRFPWRAFGIAALSVFAVVFVTMLYSVRKLKNASLIDALKDENL